MLVHVYPNPTLDLINFDLGDHAFKGLVLFYDLLGNEKKRVRLTVPMHQFEINLSNLEHGIYYYSLWDEKQDRTAFGKIQIAKID
ncbi:MAG: T9SS type A sorting domain-containing protein [Flavobacteriales bacterium]|nr:T9SS type A sorting domain-containing protein [Flavobacteriales bacterium]